MDCSCGSEVPDSGGDIYVLPHRTLETDHFESMSALRLLDDFLISLPRPARRCFAKAGGSVHAASGFVEKLRDEFPWLTDENIERVVHEHRARVGHGSRASGHAGGSQLLQSPAAVVQTEEDEQVVGDALEATRAAWASALDDTN